MHFTSGKTHSRPLCCFSSLNQWSQCCAGHRGMICANRDDMTNADTVRRVPYGDYRTNVIVQQNPHGVISYCVQSEQGHLVITVLRIPYTANTVRRIPYGEYRTRRLCSVRPTPHLKCTVQSDRTSRLPFGEKRTCGLQYNTLRI